LTRTTASKAARSLTASGSINKVDGEGRGLA
jgi:hypothetical protein